ncbi:ABC transporter permease [Blastococcus brunescens]|uniref:ABC transporter permease subunit n=1 Tax=Blastococcus brunescens TaxID=1564165 RepID=A0ABZ1B6V9_9ACTN|nr:ABC transporter permease subunit [Blastococcus sp. BMG 8361]WRL65431.1 ABC transporter permease subunit [Blastococcus sp. BMG 8361]
MLLFIIGPLIPVVIASLADKPLYEDDISFWLQNYKDLFNDAAFWMATWNTVQYAVFATVPAVLIGTVLAVLVHRTSMPLRRGVLAVMIVPLLFPGLGMTLGWVSMYSPNGLASTVMTSLFGFVPWNVYSIPGMAFLSLEKTVPLVYLLTWGRLATLDSAIESAALTAGARPLRVLRDVTLPMLRPSALLSAVVISMLVFESLGIPVILGTPAGIDTISTYLYYNWTTSTDQQGVVSAGASMLLVFVSILLLLRGRAEGATQRFVTPLGKAKAQNTLNLGRWGWPIAALCMVYLLITILLPTAGLLVRSVSSVFTPLVPPWEVLTLANFRMVFDQPVTTRSVTNSVIISVVGSILGTICILVATLVAHRSRFPVRGTMPSLLVYPRAVPGLVIGMGFFGPLCQSLDLSLCGPQSGEL